MRVKITPELYSVVNYVATRVSYVHASAAAFVFVYACASVHARRSSACVRASMCERKCLRISMFAAEVFKRRQAARNSRNS